MWSPAEPRISSHYQTEQPHLKYRQHGCLSSSRVPIPWPPVWSILSSWHGICTVCMGHVPPFSGSCRTVQCSIERSQVASKEGAQYTEHCVGSRLLKPQRSCISLQQECFLSLSSLFIYLLLLSLFEWTQNLSLRATRVRWLQNTRAIPDLGINRESTAARFQLHHKPKRGLITREFLFIAIRRECISDMIYSHHFFLWFKLL